MRGVRYVSSLGKYMATSYARSPISIVKGQGSKVWDADGNEYIDFTAGIAVTALGHSDPGVAAVVNEQVGQLLHCSNMYYNEWAPRLSAKLVKHTRASGAMSKASNVFLCNSGTEANEAALKFARKRGRKIGGETKFEVLAFDGGFHGRTFGALSATNNPKYQAPFDPMVPGFRYGPINSAKSLDLITDRTCAVIVEPIQGEGGINVCEAKWLQNLRARCNETGTTLIYDEIQCGLGRTGDLWAHKIAGSNAEPDIVTIAKALGNGFPIGATLINSDVNDALEVGDHGTTYGGNPLASRIACHVLERIDSEAIRQNVVARSKQVEQRVTQWMKHQGSRILEIRGRGLLLGIQLSMNPQALINKCRENGLLLLSCGTNTIRLVPALTISESVLDDGLQIMENALKCM